MKFIEILIDNAWDPHNYSAILNICRGFGIEKMYLYHSYNYYPPLDHQEHLDIEEVHDLETFVHQKKQQQYCFVTADLHENASMINEFDFPDKCVVVFGAEKRGISPELQKLCDETVYIPMVGLVKSYNISVSVAIFCYEIWKQRKAKNGKTTL